jgi:hypothetical protein
MVGVCATIGSISACGSTEQGAPAAGAGGGSQGGSPSDGGRNAAGASTGGTVATGGASTGGTVATGGASTGGTVATGGGVASGGAAQDAGSDGATGDASPPVPCENGVRDAQEDGVDCGFACNRPCMSGSRCTSNTDCASSLCESGHCATPLTGVHTAGLALTEASSPYVLTADTQVGNTLVIEPGVVIIGNHHVLRAKSLSAVGRCTSRITLHDVVLDSGSADRANPGNVVIRFADVFGGSLLWVGAARYQRITITDSRLRATEMLHVWYPLGPTTIERNVFLDTGPISIGMSYDDEQATAVIASNYFRGVVVTPGDVPSAITLWNSGGGSTLTVEHNTFADTGSPAVGLQYDATALNAANNYWGTTNTATFGQMIYDANDDIDLTGTIPYTPVLAAPHPSAPGPDGYADACACVSGCGAPDGGVGDAGAADGDAGTTTGDGGPGLVGTCDLVAPSSYCLETLRLPIGVTASNMQLACEGRGGAWQAPCPTSGRVGSCEADTPSLGHEIYRYYSTGGIPTTSQVVQAFCASKGWKYLP